MNNSARDLKYRRLWLKWIGIEVLLLWLLIVVVACQPRSDVDHENWIGRYRAATQINEHYTLDSTEVDLITNQIRVDAILGYLPVFGERSTIDFVAYDSSYCFVEVLFVPDEPSENAVMKANTADTLGELWIYDRTSKGQRARISLTQIK